MNNNLILEIKPEYNIQSLLRYLISAKIKLFDNKLFSFCIVIFLFVMGWILISIFPSFFQNLKRDSIEYTLIMFLFIFSPFLIIYVSALLKFRIIKKNFFNYRFKIYEDRIEITGAPSSLKRTTLKFSEIDEIRFFQNSIQKKKNLISIEFISSKEQHEYPFYNHFHENIVFFDVPNTQILHDVLNRKFNQD